MQFGSQTIPIWTYGIVLKIVQNENANIVNMKNSRFIITCMYSKTCVKRTLSKRPQLVFNANYRLMQVKSIAECSKGHSAILFTFIKLQFVIKIFELSIFKWPLKTGFTVHSCESPHILRKESFYHPHKFLHYKQM